MKLKESVKKELISKSIRKKIFDIEIEKIVLFYKNNFKWFV